VLFVAVVYFRGKSVLEQGRVEDITPPVSKKSRKVKVDEEFNGKEAETPLSTDDSAPPMSEETATETINGADVIDIAEAFLPDDITLEEEAAVPVSPFGFGPYPEVPAGFPEHLMPSWTWADEKLQEHAGALKNFELMGRVLVKLWNQGKRGFVGVTRSDENGKVYPLYPDIAYVDRWVELPVKNGKVALYPAGVLTGSGGRLGSYLNPITFIESGGKLPPDIQFVDRETEGINPYEFLNLK
jgi:hypothetical protein